MTNPIGNPDYQETERPLARSSDDHVERLLDQALEATFPASDPIAVSVQLR